MKKTNLIMKGNNNMYNVKEMFNEENFDAETLTNMIYTAMDVYDADDDHFNSYIWVSLETLEAEKGAKEIEELEGLENGFIVEITKKLEEDIWDCVVRSCVEYVNENFDREFEYHDWYDPYVEENDGEVFTDKELDSVFETCHNICLRNRYEKEPYYIMVDMENYRAVKAVKDIDPSADKDRYVFVPVKPLECYGLTDVYDNCGYALMDYFDTEFEMNMIYDFEIYD